MLGLLDGIDDGMLLELLGPDGSADGIAVVEGVFVGAHDGTVDGIVVGILEDCLTASTMECC